MTVAGYESLTSTAETHRRYEVMEMHVRKENKSTEEARCGVDCPTDNLMGADYYMEQRMNGNEVGTVCEACKARVVPYAWRRSRDLEADGQLDEAEEYRELAETLMKETGQDGSGPLGNNA